MATDNGFGRKLAKFFGVKIEDEYERPPVSAYEERNDAYLNARDRSRQSSRALPAANRSTVSSRRSVYGDDEPSRARYGFEEDDDTPEYRRPGYEPRYSYSAGSSDPRADRRRSLPGSAPRRNVSSRFVEQPQRRELPAPAPRPQKRSEQTVMFELYELRDANKVISALVQGNTIIFTIVNPDPTMATRIVDTLCGAAYALRASISQAAEQTYLLAPQSVSVRTASGHQDRRRY